MRGVGIGYQKHVVADLHWNLHGAEIATVEEEGVTRLAHHGYKLIHYTAGHAREIVLGSLADQCLEKETTLSVTFIWRIRNVNRLTLSRGSLQTLPVKASRKV